MDYLLTIAIPTYNGKRTIGRTLDILLPQINDKVEVIVCDNCSNDGTRELLEEYEFNWSCINYVKNESNIGADANYLKCMRLSHGKYIYLLSDDDVLVENSLEHILFFLESNQDMGLVYLSSVDFRVNYNYQDWCVDSSKYEKSDICTNDKEEFMKYAYRYWGFLSSFIISRAKFNEIINPEQYYGTYWLQSYICILCARGDNTNLGVVVRKCVAAGIYFQQPNFDIAEVDGENYKKMLMFAVDNGFNERQLIKWYVDRICMIASHGIIKEKAIEQMRINRKRLFYCTKEYIKPWIKIYPLFFVPVWVCKFVMYVVKKSNGISSMTSTKREGDVCSENNK